MRELYELARPEMEDVNETNSRSYNDTYLTEFDEKWAFLGPVRLPRQSDEKNKTKKDAKHWELKLETVKRYDEAPELWQRLKEDIWRYNNDNKRVQGHNLKLCAVNESRSQNVMAPSFWNLWYYQHCAEMSRTDDKQELSKMYIDIMLEGQLANYMQSDWLADNARFQQELDAIRQRLGGWTQSASTSTSSASSRST